MKIKSFAIPVNSFLPLFFILAFLTGCTKEEKTEPDYTKVYLIKKKTVLSVSRDVPLEQYYNYEYSEGGDIIKITLDSPLGKDNFDYTHTGSNMIRLIHSSDYSNPDTTYIELNSNGQAVSLVNIQQKRITRYTYDSQGYCTNTKYSAYGADTSDILEEIERATFTYLDGNLLLEKRVYNNTGIGSIQNYYYKDKINIAGYANMGMGFFGKSSKNLLKPANVTDEFDAEGRLTKRTESELVTTYEYY